MNRFERPRRAWVLRWSWVGDYAVDPYPWIRDRPVVAILDPRTADKKVGRLVEQIYSATVDEPVDMLDALIDRSQRPRAAPGSVTVDDGNLRQTVDWTGQQFHCGDSLMLEAFKATVRRGPPDEEGGIPTVIVERDPRPDPR